MRAAENQDVVVDGVTSVLVVAGSPRELSDRIAELLVDPARRRRMGGAGRRRVEQEFSEARMVSETANVYREVAGG